MLSPPSTPPSLNSGATSIDDVVVGQLDLAARAGRIEQVLHRVLEELVAALDARIERHAGRRVGERPVVLIDIGRRVEVDLPARGLPQTSGPIALLCMNGACAQTLSSEGGR